MRFASSSFGSALILAASLAVAAPTSAWAGAGRIAPAAAADANAAARAVNPGAGVRVLSGTLAASPKETIDALERAGYHVDVAVLPGTFFVRGKPNAAALPAGFVDVTPALAAPGARNPGALRASPFRSGVDGARIGRVRARPSAASRLQRSATCFDLARRSRGGAAGRPRVRNPLERHQRVDDRARGGADHLPGERRNARSESLRLDARASRFHRPVRGARISQVVRRSRPRTAFRSRS